MNPRVIFCLFALLLSAIRPACAAESPAVSTPHAMVSLVSETDRVAAGAKFRIGLRFQINPGWHIYWVNPGDAGQAPELDLTLPEGGTSTPIVWPVPHRTAEGAVMTYAYTGTVLLPLTVTLPHPGDAPVIEAAASWLICQKICVPEEGKFRLVLTTGLPGPSAEATQFAAADAAMPVPSPFAATISADGILSLTGDGLSARNVGAAWFLPIDSDVIDNDAEQALSVQPGVLRLALKPGAAFPVTKALSGVLILQDPMGQETALQITAQPVAAAGGTGIALVLLYAFLGGLILNLMPCVFPVLAMKAISIARLSGTERKHIRSHAGFYTLGVVSAFTALGLALLALREAGSLVGWGFQFQSPVFVAGMACLLFVTGLNLSGVFVVALPVRDDLVERSDQGGSFGSFCTGLLAVLLATPCSAPFMTVALAAALAAPAIETAAVFAVLGLGLASPYALLAAWPGLATLLPRPGAWMNWLKQILAIPIYGSALWLIWVGQQQLGEDGIIAMAAGLLLAGTAAFAFGAAQRRDGRSRLWLQRGAYGAAVLVIGSLWLVSGAAQSPGSIAQADDGSEAFSPERLATLRAEGRPVFIDMTAAWCVTCLVNERVALSGNAMREAFAAHRVAYLKGDWTKRDPAISQFLQEHQHEGVPLYVFYPAGNAPPEILPQILSESLVVDAAKRLGS